MVDYSRPSLGAVDSCPPKNGLSMGEFVEDANFESRQYSGDKKEDSVWEVYNNEARKVDIELVKDWTASLNFLLVFASIFAAVLTAFIVDSKKMLEQDPTDLLVGIMIFYINNNAANTTPISYNLPQFHPTSAAVSINCLLFASLGASLVAALSSVLALQWVANYDAVINRGGSSPEDRAKRRQFRFAGVVTWKMAEIIAALPLLLHSSVALFLAGATQWMWTLNHTVGAIVAGGTGLAVLLYATTTILSALYSSAPFSTPLSTGLSWLLRVSVSHAGRCLLLFPIDAALLRGTLLLGKMRSSLISLTRTRATPAPYTEEHSWFYQSEPAPSPPAKPVGDWIAANLVHKNTQEGPSVEQQSNIKDQALGWLAQQLPISTYSNHQLLLLIKEIHLRAEENYLPQIILDAPWGAILDSLGRQYLEKILYGTLLEEDREAIEVLIRWILIPEIEMKISPAKDYEKSSITDQYWNQCCFDTARPKTLQFTSSENMAFLLARDIPVPSPGSKPELEATIKLIRWRNAAGPKQVDIWIEVFSHSDQYSSRYLESCVQCFELVMKSYEQSLHRALWPSARSRFCLEVCR